MLYLVRILLSLLCLYIIWRLIRPVGKINRRLNGSVISDDATVSDPSLLRKHTQFASISVPSTGYTYPRLRLFYSPHPQAAKLPQLPLLVFIHGLGGSVAQWHPLLTSLVNLAPCLALDMPGCGLSHFAPKDWPAFTTHALVELLAQVIDKYREPRQDVVLVCHSMGCALGALLASTTSPYASRVSRHVSAVVALCPPAKIIPRKQVSVLRRLLTLPGFSVVFNMWRKWDKRGGTEAASVARFTGPNAEMQLKRLQVRFNSQSRTPVFMRMACGALPTFDSHGKPHGGALLGKDIWAGIRAPVLLIAGTDDPVTTVAEATQIASYLGHGAEPDSHHAAPALRPPAWPDLQSSDSPHTPSGTHSVSKLVVLPSPASHALLYSPLTVRPVSSLIQNFLSETVNHRLSLGWQLQHLTTEGKWDVKNLAKWSAVEPVSKPIASIFRAMKTLREIDGEHTPKAFVNNWAPTSGLNTGFDGLGPIVAVVDISHDSPVYDPQGLEAGGIMYRKFPTVSKMPPTRDEVKHFIDLIDHVRSELDLLPASTTGDWDERSMQPGLIAVHCHYGFNRTGFFVISYLVERMGWPLDAAMDEFEKKRPPGVRHSHFVDELHGRYWDWTDERSKLLT